MAGGVEVGRRGFESLQGVFGAGRLNAVIWRAKPLFRVRVISLASMKL